MTQLDHLIPAYDADAESAVLGSLVLADPALQRRLRLKLEPADFYVPQNADLWQIAGELLDAGKPLDALTLYAALVDQGKAREIGGVAALGEILNSVPSAYHGEHYADRVMDLAQRRQAATVLRRTLASLEAKADSEDANDAIRAAACDLMRVLNRRSGLKTYTLEQSLHHWIEEREKGKSPVLLTGIPEVDAFSGILTFGGYTIIGGRPSQGKSTLIRWLLGVLSVGWPCGLIALEENRHKIAGNYLSAETEIENDRLAYGSLNGNDWAKLTDAVGCLAPRKLTICDEAFNLDQVLAAAETLIAEQGCKVIAVDHIHLMQHGRSRSGKSSWNRNDQLTEMSAALKELGKRHQVVLIVAAQLSRPEKGVPNPPQLTDLRESGSLEQDADAVLMVHREDYYRRNEAPTNEARIGIEKNRNGKVGFVTLKAELQYQRFSVANQYPDVDWT